MDKQALYECETNADTYISVTTASEKPVTTSNCRRKIIDRVENILKA